MLRVAMKLLHLAPVAIAAAAILSAAATRADETPACIRVSTMVRASMPGYDHIVTLESSCTRTAACEVSTDVAPDPIHADVEAKQRVDLVTFRGSPASTFKAKVACKLK
jgi:hypothetical protein